jgi:hypothetical protein
MLEELHVDYWLDDGFVVFAFGAIATMPRLRCLSLGDSCNTIFADHLEALLDNPDLKLRLECLSMADFQCDNLGVIARVLKEFTALLSFTIVGPGFGQLNPMTQSEWTAEVDGEYSSGFDHDVFARPFLCPTEDNAFRSRLLHLRFENCDPPLNLIEQSTLRHQLLARIPSLICVQYNHRDSPDADKESQEPPPSWLPPPFAKPEAASSSSSATPRLHSALELNLPEPATFGEVDQFQLVRALKIAAGLPLNDSERNRPLRNFQLQQKKKEDELV